MATTLTCPRCNGSRWENTELGRYFLYCPRCKTREEEAPHVYLERHQCPRLPGV